MAGSFLQATSSTSDATTYTFSSQNIGTAASDRYIVCGATARKAGAATTLSVSIGGVSSTQIVEQWTADANNNVSGLDMSAVPTGTTGDVVLTFGATMVRAGIALWRLDDLASATPHDSDSSTASAPSVALDIPDDGYAIGIACSAFSGTVSWTGLTEQFDSVIESNLTSSGASDAFASAETGRTITSTFTTSVQPTGAFASWAFGAVGGVTVNAPSTDIAVAAQAPAVNTGKTIAVPAVNVAIAASAPAVNAGKTIAVPAVDIAIAAQAPSVTAGSTVGASVDVPSIDVAIAAQAPSIAAGKTIAIPAAAIAIAAAAPSVLAGDVVTEDEVTPGIITNPRPSRTVEMTAADVDWSIVTRRLEATVERDWIEKRNRTNKQLMMLLMAA